MFSCTLRCSLTAKHKRYGKRQWHIESLPALWRTFYHLFILHNINSEITSSTFSYVQYKDHSDNAFYFSSVWFFLYSFVFSDLPVKTDSEVALLRFPFSAILVMLKVYSVPGISPSTSTVLESSLIKLSLWVSQQYSNSSLYLTESSVSVIPKETVSWPTLRAVISGGGTSVEREMTLSISPHYSLYLVITLDHLLTHLQSSCGIGEASVSFSQHGSSAS